MAASLFVRTLRWLGSPTAPRALSRGDEAAAVRALAYEVQHTDPGFAADLYAAAARHESMRD